jgi:hypothetical protein
VEAEEPVVPDPEEVPLEAAQATRFPLPEVLYVNLYVFVVFGADMVIDTSEARVPFPLTVTELGPDTVAPPERASFFEYPPPDATMVLAPSSEEPFSPVMVIEVHRLIASALASLMKRSTCCDCCLSSRLAWEFFHRIVPITVRTERIATVMQISAILSPHFRFIMVSPSRLRPFRIISPLLLLYNICKAPSPPSALRRKGAVTLTGIKANTRGNRGFPQGS